MKTSRPLAASLLLLAGAVMPGCMASEEECKAAFEASIEIAVNGAKEGNPNINEAALAAAREKAEAGRDGYMQTCSKTTSTVAKCMGAAKTLAEQKECVPKK